MMDNIYRLFTEDFIDLSKIVSIGVLNKSERDFRFTIHFQLMSLPCLYTIKFENDDYFPTNGGHSYSFPYQDLYRYDKLSQDRKDVISNENLKMYNEEFEDARVNYDNFIEDWIKFNKNKI